MFSLMDMFFGQYDGDLAIDLGTANTLVSVRGKGIVIREPSVVAIDKNDERILAVGIEAKRMLGRTPGNIVAVRPLKDGVIADFDVTEAMLRYFIDKASEKRYPWTPRPRVVVCVPSGVTSVEKRAVFEATIQAGARQAYLIEEPMAAAIGADLPVEEPTGSMVIDIGGGTTEVAVIAMGGIVVSQSIRIAGDEFDQAILQHVRDAYNLAIGERTAEDIKIKVGSAVPLKDELDVEVNGRDVITGLPKTVRIESEEIRRALNKPLDEMTKAVKDASRRAAQAESRLAATSPNGKSARKTAKKSGHNTATMSKYANKVPFGKSMKKDYTIVGPQMSPIHMSLVESVIRSGGYKFDILKTASREDVELGLKYVNNDACYPAIMVIGQLVDAIVKGKYDPDHVALAITQTGGMCRATNYFGLIRKALIDAGYPQVPVIALSTQGFEDNPGFKATPTLLHRAIKALVVGDLLLKCLMRVRPYEVEKGSADKLYQMWDTIVRETIEHHGFSDTAKKKIGKHYLPYQTLLKEIVKSFDALPLRDIPRKVRVGVVGEILVKYHPDANNHVVDVIESQDCEAVVPGIMEFMTTRPYITDWNEKNLGMGGNKKLYSLMRWGLDRYLNPVRAAIDLAHGKFSQDLPMPELVKKASEVTSVGVQAGEGWLLTAEILELIESGCPNVICAQPFACLPNHVTGRGMFGKIRRLHPDANIVSIDYDPGASQANQLNRIKLMIAAAKKNHQKLTAAN